MKIILLEPFFRIVDAEARYMCICSKNTNPEHLDETKIFLIVIFHVFMFRKCPNSRIFDRFHDSFSAGTEQIHTFCFSFDSKCVLYSAFISSPNKKSSRSTKVSMANQNKVSRKR